MLYKTRGIVFKTTDYSETSVVAQIFTEKFGLQSYLINGVKKPRAKINQNILQPLFLLDMVVYHKPSGGIQRIAEVRHQPAFLSIPYDIVKSSLVMFLNEVLYKSIRQQTADDVLFEFLFHAIEILDRTEQGISNFHLYFLLRLTRFLGFYPDNTLAKHSNYFDLQNGDFSIIQPPHKNIIEPEQIGKWKELINSNFDNLHLLSVSSIDRRIILAKILDYYQLHIEGFGLIKSHHVLEEVLS
ncbi:DNA repair protein RecO [Daejeonella oryzae]|uniref:DNA repair protein RecO n=1 Tax=Daejeonella oryzae TaxID=1122943 RepID=UPI00040678D3|nr:DNA repair protein RecO [Daejeonella oryzae]